MESAITPTTIEQDEQPAKLEESALLESKQQVTSIESLPQTITNPSIPPPQATTTASYITEEICDDDLNNDVDGKVNSRDEECSTPPDHPFLHPDRCNQ
jgi:hypothetical protein